MTFPVTMKEQKMAQVRLKAPKGASSVFLPGAGEYPVVDGHIEVPDVHATTLKGAHGFGDPDPVEEAEEEDEPVADAIDPDTMTKKELVAFLRGEGVAFDKDSTGAELRELVKAHLADKG